MSAPSHPTLDQLVEQELATVLFQSREEVLLAAVKLLHKFRNRQQDELRADVQAGFAQLDGEEAVLLDQDDLRALFDKLQDEGRQRYDAAKAGE